MLVTSLIGGCSNKQQPTNDLIVGKWRMVEYVGGYVNTLDTLSFYKNEKVNCPPEIGEFTYRQIKPNSLIIYNHGLREQYYKNLNYLMTA